MMLQYLTGSLLVNLNNNTYTNNNPNGIQLLGSSIGGPAILTKDNAPYIITQDIGIVSNGPTVVLTLQPGVEIRFNPGTGLTFTGYQGGQNGALNAQGTASQPIKLTSNAATPAPGDWDGLYFTDRTDGAMTVLDYCVIEYAGSGANNAIRVENSLPQ